MIELYLNITIFSLCLVLASSYLLPKTRSPPRTRRPEIKLPPEFILHGHKIQPELRIPNHKFCKDKQLEPFRNYMVLPWWHNYCERILEKEERKIKENRLFRPLYGHVLSMVDEYKKNMARQ